MSTLERLTKMLADDFGVPRDKLQADATLESLDIDSLRLIEIVFAVEEQFKVAMPQDQGEIRTRVKTLGDLAALIEELAAK